MKFYTYSALKKATLSLLDLFNNISLEYITSEGDVTHKVIPCMFRSKEKALLLDEHTTQSLLEGNTSILPRLSLSFISMTINDERKTHRQNIPFKSEKKYIFNATPVDLSFELNFICRTMTELSMFIEQLYPLFNPYYTLKIREFIDTLGEDFTDEPTTIRVKLDNPSIDIDDDNDSDIRLIKCTIPLIYEGNLYPPILDIKKIEKIRIYLAETDNETYQKVFKYEKIINESGVTEYFDDLRPTVSATDESMKPVINDIMINKEDKIVKFKIDYNDPDNEGSEIEFIIGSNKGTIYRENNSFISGELDLSDANIGDQIIITAQAIDYHGNKSNIFTKIFTL